ncbi:MAG TPA: 16S rRNA (cytidine(1402)-2'-O)-methyltransferase [Verrucomicrobiae bacterium]|nr:16S rRNA (cytidine(1402)-2'-O)-methyltransferase [Verrucomicrobiae bacterium]
MPKEKTVDARNGAGCLYVVATPIGNLEDITLRAIRVLKEADAIACEDTRQTAKLLHHFGIQKRMVSYHEHNEITRASELVIELEQGAQVALVSDAGTPGISDPGHRLVGLCIRHGIRVVPIPGANAMLTALGGSPLPGEQFTFVGFLPSRPTERRKALRGLAGEPRTMVLYEAPHRLLDTLEDALEILGNRPAVIARELTKIHEEFLRGHLDELVAALQKKEVRGEITLLLGPADAAKRLEGEAEKTHLPLAKRVAEIVMEKGVDQKAALKQAARERGMTRREAYKELLITREE